MGPRGIRTRGVQGVLYQSSELVDTSKVRKLQGGAGGSPLGPQDRHVVAVVTKIIANGTQNAPGSARSTRMQHVVDGRTTLRAMMYMSIVGRR